MNKSLSKIKRKIYKEITNNKNIKSKWCKNEIYKNCDEIQFIIEHNKSLISIYNIYKDYKPIDNLRSLLQLLIKLIGNKQPTIISIKNNDDLLINITLVALSLKLTTKCYKDHHINDEVIKEQYQQLKKSVEYTDINYTEILEILDNDELDSLLETIKDKYKFMCNNYIISLIE